MLSQKEQAALLKKELEQNARVKPEADMIQIAKADLQKERKAFEDKVQEVIGARGFLISVPNTEVVLYENDDFQFLYCNHSEYPGKISFYMAFKRGVNVTSDRTPITQNGYVAKSMPKDQMNLILNMIQGYRNQITGLTEINDKLEKEMAPLRYIDHLIKTYKVDTK